MSKFVACLVLIVTCDASYALQSFEGKVVTLQPTYMPGIVSFMMDSGNATCPAGSWLQWKNADQSNNKAVYATLLAAFTAAKSIRLYINDGDTTCTGAFMHMIN